MKLTLNRLYHIKFGDVIFYTRIINHLRHPGEVCDCCDLRKFCSVKREKNLDMLINNRSIFCTFHLLHGNTASFKKIKL